MVDLNFPNELVLERKGGNSNFRDQIIFCLKACKMIPKGCLYHIVRVKYFYSEVPHIEMVPVVREFLEVYPNDIPEIPPEWEIDFGIDLLLDSNPFQFLHIGWIRPNWKS